MCVSALIPEVELELNSLLAPATLCTVTRVTNHAVEARAIDFGRLVGRDEGVNADLIATVTSPGATVAPFVVRLVSICPMSFLIQRLLTGILSSCQAVAVGVREVVVHYRYFAFGLSRPGFYCDLPRFVVQSSVFAPQVPPAGAKRRQAA